MEKYQLYILRLEDAKIIPSKMWFDDIYTAMEYCVLKNRAQVELNVEQYYYFYFLNTSYFDNDDQIQDELGDRIRFIIDMENNLSDRLRSLRSKSIEVLDNKNKEN